MIEFNSYYEKLSSTQRRIEERARQWQAQLRWKIDTETILSFRSETDPSQLPAFVASGILLDRLAIRRDGQYTLFTLPTHAGSRAENS